MKHMAWVVAGLLFVLLLGGCASGTSGKNPDGTPKDDQSVSTLPWNKPASWEGQSAIPGSGGH
ncbi:MAG: hypothetical protein EBS59_03490 [Verrucomicrobia bacterium]|nr:hypothetical protein [Verrucomicrobiota bacterium]